MLLKNSSCKRNIVNHYQEQTKPTKHSNPLIVGEEKYVSWILMSIHPFVRLFDILQHCSYAYICMYIYLFTYLFLTVKSQFLF